MLIKQKTVYVMAGIEFPTEQKALQHIENMTGDFIDRMCANAHNVKVRDKIAMFQFIQNNRAELLELLTLDKDYPEQED